MKRSRRKGYRKIDYNTIYLYIVNNVDCGKYITYNELAEHFGCTTMSIYKYIKEMKAEDYPIIVKRGCKGGVRNCSANIPLEVYR